MPVETVAEYLARGGQIREIPMGAIASLVEDYKWDKGPPLVSKAHKTKPALVKPPIKIKTPSPLQKIYLDHMLDHPGQQPRFVAVALGWAVSRVHDTKKSCIRSGWLTSVSEEFDHTTHKFCSKCKTVLPLNKFSKNNSKKSGLQTTCAVCQSTTKRKSRQRSKQQ